MQRDDFSCRACGAKESTLHVHHTFYKWPRIDPWQYPDTSLITLCADCHSLETEFQKSAKEYLIEELCKKGFLVKDFHDLANKLIDNPDYVLTVVPRT